MSNWSNHKTGGGNKNNRTFKNAMCTMGHSRTPKMVQEKPCSCVFTSASAKASISHNSTSISVFKNCKENKKNKQFTNLAHQTLFGWLNSHYHSLYYPSFPELDKNVVIKIAVWTEVFFLDQGICWTSGKDFKSLEHGTSSTFVPGSGRSNSKKRSNKKISEWGGKNKTTILELQFDCCAFYFWVPY